MPYIPKTRRGLLQYDPIEFPESPGELNFVISDACHEYTNDHGLNYDTINTVIGVLECAKMEFYRMIAHSYENEKRKKNGPISELDEWNNLIPES